MSDKQTQPLPFTVAAMRRECFVTVGATASFRSLLDQVLSDSFILTLIDLEYTHLAIQCGPDLVHAKTKIFGEDAQGVEMGGLWEGIWRGLKVKLFDFNKLGLGAEMRGCKGLGRGGREGIVVCHAGAGSILDAMRLDVPIIVVPNPALLDNHQAELAAELERQDYATYGRLNDLPSALRNSEKKSKARTRWQPLNTTVDPTGKGVVGVMDEELGYEDRMREVLD